jgi:hypothetical protein
MLSLSHRSSSLGEIPPSCKNELSTLAPFVEFKRVCHTLQIVLAENGMWIASLCEGLLTLLGMSVFQQMLYKPGSISVNACKC